jgi:hypothetical protein
MKAYTGYSPKRRVLRGGIPLCRAFRRQDNRTCSGIFSRDVALYSRYNPHHTDLCTLKLIHDALFINDWRFYFPWFQLLFQFFARKRFTTQVNHAFVF